MLKQPEIVRFLLAHHARLVAYGWAIVGDEHAAEDLVQQAAMAATSKPDQIESVEHLDRWLRQAIRFHAMNHLRTQRRRPVVFSEDIVGLVDDAWDRIAAVDNADMSDALRGCLDELTDNNRRIIHLRYMEGRKCDEVAKVMGRNVQAIYRALTRAHKALAECIDRRTEGGAGRG